jgi:two-component system phosphate regulon sensor histidine kinase PhoR
LKPVRASLLWKAKPTFLSLVSVCVLNPDFLGLTIRAAGDGHAPLAHRVLSVAAVNFLLPAQDFLLATAILLILVLIIWCVSYSRRITRSASKLEQFSRRISAGDFRPLPMADLRGELGDLARSLNGAAANLSATIGALTEEKNRSSAILRSMVEGVAVIDSGEHLAFCNEAFSEIVGMSAARAEGRPILEVIRQPEILELVRRALAGEEGLQGEMEVGGVRRRTFGVTVSPVSPAAPEGTAQPGRPIGAVAVLHEITELRRLEQVRKDFVANVSHELKTPLTSIQGFAETLLGGALDDPKNSRRFVEIIRNHALRLSRLTDDLLKLSRIEAGKLGLDLQPVSLFDLIGDAVEAARPRAERGQLSLSFDCPPDLAPVRGDANLLREVLQNLLDNAIQYTPAGGRIDVSAAETDGFAVVTVADTGIGIPEAEQTRIFERFYRVDAARSRELGSTGLGLSIVRHIVEAHGGRVGVESAVGRGSKFFFTIPLAE